MKFMYVVFHFPYMQHIPLHK